LADTVPEVRLLALVPIEARSRTRRHLAPLGVTIDFFDVGPGLTRQALSKHAYQVVLVPAALPGAGWWALWSEIGLLDPRPEVVVYAQSAGFALWAAVLEMGGYDVIVEPFTEKELREAISHAAENFARRSENEDGGR
jgi:DNA-binding NtrC family response regulator